MKAPSPAFDDLAGWTARTRLALASPAPLVPDDLLVERNLDGSLACRFAPPEGADPRSAAVVALLARGPEEVALLLTVRPSGAASHAGEVCLPGGRLEPDDPSPEAAARRECEEELGLPRDQLDVLGPLHTTYIEASSHVVIPFAAAAPEGFRPVPQPREVQRVVAFPLRRLLDDASVCVETWPLRGTRVRVPFFEVDRMKVWGATALILSDLKARLRKVL